MTYPPINDPATVIAVSIPTGGCREDVAKRATSEPTVIAAAVTPHNPDAVMRMARPSRGFRLFTFAYPTPHYWRWQVSGPYHTRGIRSRHSRRGPCP